MNTHFIKTTLLFIGLELVSGVGFCQQKLVAGFIVGSGIPNLSIGYSQPDRILGGLTLLKPLNLGIYGEYTVHKQIKTGLDITYCRLPLEVSDGRGNVTFLERFSYLNLAPYIAYEPLKWISVGFNFSVRPLLNYSPKLFPASAALLSYYGPRLTIRPIKQIGVDLGYEVHTRPFAIATILGGYASLSNTMVYVNLRLIPFYK